MSFKFESCKFNLLTLLRDVYIIVNYIFFWVQDYYNQLFGIKTINSNSVSQALCLPVSVSELVEVNQSGRVSDLHLVYDNFLNSTFVYKLQCNKPIQGSCLLLVKDDDWNIYP